MGRYRVTDATEEDVPTVTTEEILQALKNVHDPEIGINIVDLGLVYGLDVTDEGRRVHIDLTLTSPGCPLGPEIMRQIQRELRALDYGLQVDVQLVWKPLWHPSRMTEAAREQLGYDEDWGSLQGDF